jgi:membrane-bound lytic murein transglycosylase D
MAYLYKPSQLRVREAIFSSGGLMGRRPARSLHSMALRAALVAWVLSAAAGSAEAEPQQFPRPPQLEPDVQFWERIYTKVTTQGGLLHDDRYLDIVYQQIDFPAGMSPRERSDLVDGAREHIEHILKKLASGVRDGLSEDETRVLAAFAPTVSAAALRDASEHVRFQLGQSDRFREGLVRAGAWERHVEETLRKQGLPGELSALPHVESSFNPRAYSKVGAAGMWQFMRSTGRRWLRVDNVVDERLDPYKSTVAAAQFLAINYSILGTWPLALTAYNHGAGGMRRAKELMGTDDIVTVVRNYQSHSFGFASRNFYVSFLAALEIDRKAEQFFGHFERLPEDASRTLRVPHYVPVAALERALGTDRDTLRNLNFSLMDPVWNGQRFIPRGFELRVPAGTVEPERALAKLGVGDRFDGQMRDATHRVRRGETLERVAAAYGLRAADLASYNGLAAEQAVTPGQTLKLPPVQPAAIAATAPVTDALAPPAGTAAAPEPAGELYVVRSGDALSEIAKRFGLSEQMLMSQNGIKDRNFLFEGQTLRVSKAPPAVLAARMPTVTVELLSREDEVADEAKPTESARAKPQPVSKEQAAELGPGLVPGIESAASADPSDYSVSGDTAIVQGGETLGHFADWLGVNATRLRTLNHMRPGAALTLGHRIRLDLSRVDAAKFEERRTRFHRREQDDFFQRFRITAQDRYRLKSGESLWTLTQKTNVPVWLVRQYNPETDFTTVRIGTEIVLPRIESVAAQQATPAAAGRGRG